MERGARLTLLGLIPALIVACGGEAPKQDKEEMRAKGRDTDETVFDDLQGQRSVLCLCGDLGQPRRSGRQAEDSNG